MKLRGLKVTASVASVAVAAAVASGTLGGTLKADGPPSGSPGVSKLEERFGHLLLGGQGIVRSSRALGTFAVNSADYKLCSLQNSLPPQVFRRKCDASKKESHSNDRLEKLHKRSADRILWLCETNRGVYIKAGQFVATLHQLPQEYRSTLSVLQDQARGRPFKVIDKVFKKEFGRSAKEIFLEFEEKPIAAASLAQVHRAKLHDGREVAVKVQYPGLERQVATDISTMAILSKAVNWFFPEYQISWMVPQFQDNLGQQLDFVREGRNAQETAINFLHKPEVQIPNIHWDLTTRRILTMDFMRGCKVDDVDGIKAQGINPLKVATLLVEVFAEMVFCHGHLHGDPHPGNVLIRKAAQPFPSGRDFELVLLDHGLYRELDEKFRLDFCHLWKALILCDERGVERWGQVLGAGKYSRYLPALFTSRSFASKAQWGEAMPKDEAKALQKQLNLADLSAIVDNLPDDLFLVLRTDNLIRAHIKKLGAKPKLRLVINGRYAVQGLAWRNAPAHDSMSNALIRQAWAYVDYSHLTFRIWAWEVLVNMKSVLKQLQAHVADAELLLWSLIRWAFVQ